MSSSSSSDKSDSEGSSFSNEADAVRQEEEEEEETTEEFWDDAGVGTQGDGGAGFSQADYDLIYGKNRAPKMSDQPELLRATVNLKTFGKMETMASRDARSILPRLRSIYLDASKFVSRVRGAFPDLPCLANLRNGLWYFEAPPDGDCRFRSSDGHSRSWGFHLPRANVACAQLAVARRGTIIVDSTRSGKSFPDSFNRTVPLWCCVMNRAMGFSHADLHLPPWLPRTERYHLPEDRIDAFAKELEEFMAKTNCKVKSELPLKPFWIANDLFAWGVASDKLERLVEEVLMSIDSCIPIICVSASAVIDPMQHREKFSWSYVPGAADDEENWSLGLTPDLFWKNMIQLIHMCANSDECEDAVRKIVAANGQREAAGLSTTTATASTDGSRSHGTVLRLSDDLNLYWSASADEAGMVEGHQSTGGDDKDNCIDLNWLHGEDKAWGRKNPRAWHDRALPEGLTKFRKYLSRGTDGEGSVSKPFWIRARDGETALTMALAIVCVFCDDDLQVIRDNGAAVATVVDKHTVKTREACIIARAQAAGSGSTAISRRLSKEVSEFLSSKKHLADALG